MKLLSKHKLLQEVTIKDGNKADLELYHFFTDISDLVSSLMDNSIWSNKNERASQFDMQAAYDADTDTFRDDAYVCFTTYPGKRGIYKGYQRPFGISFDENTFDTSTTSTKIFSQAAFKTCKNVKNADIIKRIQNEYKTKYGEAYGTHFINDISNQSFHIQALGIIPVFPEEKEIYLHSDDPGHKYFISGGDSEKPWTARYLPITKETTVLYKFIKKQFMIMLNDPKYKGQIYWFTDKNYIGKSNEKFKLSPESKVYKGKSKKDDQLVDTSEMIFNDTITYISDSTATVHVINPKFNLNPNYCPRPDQSLYYPNGAKSPVVRFSATISFPTDFKNFNEIIGIGRILWDDSRLTDFNFVNSSSRSGYSSLAVTGLSITSLLPFLNSMEEHNYDVNQINLTKKDFENVSNKVRTSKNLSLTAPVFKTFISAFNEHEKRVYINNKKNLTFNRPSVKSIILPPICKIASVDINLENLITYIQQYKSDETKRQIKNIIAKLPKKFKEKMNLIDELKDPSKLSDKALVLLTHYKDGMSKCLKQQIIEIQEKDADIPEVIQKSVNTAAVLPTYHIKILRDFCRLLENPAAYGNTAIEFIQDGKQKRIVDKLTNAYKKIINEITNVVEDTLVDDTDSLQGVPISFFQPEINKNGAPNYSRYLINAKNFFDFDKAFTDEDNRVYPDEISVLAPVKPQLVVGSNATTGQNARVGAEALIVGFDAEGNSYLLMVPKPHLSINFFELPGGGLAKKESLFNESARIKELEEKINHKAGIPKTDIDYIIKSYPQQLLFSETSTSDNTDVLAKISWSFYFLSGGIYTKLINPKDLEFRHKNKDYNAYLSWFPIKSIEYKNVFLARYIKLLPYIKVLANEGKKYLKDKINQNTSDENSNQKAVNTADELVDESLVTNFFNNFWK